MPKVNSSTILSYNYNATTQILTMKFKSGRNYLYKNVPKDIVNNFKESESKGSFFSNNIRDQYVTEEL